MTAAAVSTETAVVHVIRLMAAHAGSGSLVCRRVTVTTITGKALVLTGQFKIGGIVIEAPQAPAVGVMAVPAGAAQGAFMAVVVSVAIVASGWERGIAAFGVAALASGQRVQTVEREAGQVVIETDFLAPALHLMAGVALSAEIALMDVFGFVTITAFTYGCVFLDTAGMTGIAGCLGMRAPQGEIGVLVMIERGFSPVLGAVTVLTAFTVTPLVDIVSTMTVITLGGGLLGVLPRAVAGTASDFDMPTA